ncbi:hypothetical protein N0V90_013428 [Kalmusia sp. IMI 367209]|nr:hypothetical protein N0V90_013428 [Kalmusia sp. IMI 367209]
MTETDSELVMFANALSRVLGWAYFLSWSASFYPQAINNWRRKSTLGLAIDFPTLNLLGFACYAVNTAAFLFSSKIRSQYAYRHPAAPEPTVRFNDFLFAAHGAFMCVILYSQFFSQIWGFRVGARQKASKAALGIFWGCVLAIIVVIFFAQVTGEESGYDPSGWAWIDVIYALGYVKLITVIVKYIPQAWVNFKRKSTEGWSIYPMLMDFTGGWLSMAQLVLDASLQNDWTGVTDNPVKFGLGNITIVFDIVFFLQHYVLYRHPAKSAEEEEDWNNEQEGLLS